MRKILSLTFLLLLLGIYIQAQDIFPDGSRIPLWFKENPSINIGKLGKHYRLTDYNILNDSSLVQTELIQSVIDKAHQTGGVIIIPKGTFLSGALFFKPNTHLHIEAGGVLKGSDDIRDYPKIPSRMEGQNLDYFAALVNVYGVDGFTISGKGKIDGNGLRYWQSFWNRRKENPKCTNLEVSRPRLVFVWKSDNVQLHDIKLHNSGFWTSHFFQCNYLKLINLDLRSPYTPVKAPSTDAIDLDVCNNVLIKGCYMSVNDDAIALKGGKGPWADKDSTNGANTNIIIEDSGFGFCHAALTLGSEAIHNKNILMRNCKVNDAKRLLWLKMRPDTPQIYEYIRVENVSGNAYSLIYVKPWTQFFDLQGRKDIPISYSTHVTLKNINLKCEVFFDVAKTDSERLSNFKFENLNILAKKTDINKSLISDFYLKNVKVNGEIIK
jgi:hypothetical protein